MANDKVVNNQKVTDMLKKMLQLGDAFIVDINNMVHYANSPDEPIYLQSNSKAKKKLYIYSTNIKDPEAIILNPLSETLSGGAERLLFYSSLSYVLGQWMYRVLSLIVEECAKQKNSDSNEVDPKLIFILTPFMDKIDDKSPAELERIKNAGIKDFCNIYYNRTKKKSTLLMGFEDETGDYMKSFPNGKIRKKSWEVFLEICKFILDVQKEDKIKDVYSSSTEKIECPQFTTFSSVWIKAWEKINYYLDWFDGHHSDPELIESLKEHIKNAPVYRECVLWLKQPTAISMESFDAGTTKSPSNNNSEENKSTQQKVPSWLNTAPSNYNQAPAPFQQTVNTPSWMIGLENNSNYGNPQQFYNGNGFNQTFSNGFGNNGFTPGFNNGWRSW